MGRALGWSKTGNVSIIQELGGFLMERYELTLPFSINPKQREIKTSKRINYHQVSVEKRQFIE